MATALTTPGLMGLPAELRNDIYKLVFAGNRVSLEYDPSWLWETFKITAPPPALLLCSKQIYNGALSMYYQYSIFEVLGHHVGVANWLAGIPAACRACLEEVRLNYAHVTDDEGRLLWWTSRLAYAQYSKKAMDELYAICAARQMPLPAGCLKVQRAQVKEWKTDGWVTDPIEAYEREESDIRRPR